MRAAHRSTRLCVLVIVIVGLSCASVGQAWSAPIAYDEAVSGELQGQSIGTFDIGANTVTGTEQPLGGTSVDLFLFTIADGQQLDSIVLSAYNSVGVQGFTLSPPGMSGLASRYGSLLVAGTNVGTDMLPALLLSDPGKTATAPLPAGVYQVLLGSIATAGYQYTFNVSAAPSALPEPASLTLTGLGLLGTAYARRRATRRRPAA